jgi:hypothetical protein
MERRCDSIRLLPGVPGLIVPGARGDVRHAYHWLGMLREAYTLNGTPRTDDVLMGLARPEFQCVLWNDDDDWVDAHCVEFTS